jgi:hypothetical protein
MRTRLVQWLPDKLGDVEDDLEILSTLRGRTSPTMAHMVLFSHVYRSLPVRWVVLPTISLRSAAPGRA